MVDAFGAISPRHWKGRIARNKAEDWINNIIKDVRSNKLQVEENTHFILLHIIRILMVID